MDRKQHNILILVLGSLTAIGPFSIDMYLPGFPSIAKDLHTDIPNVALSLTSYFIGISIGQLLYGPLLDRYGRKKPIIAGVFIYIVAAVGCGLSPTIDWLIAQRFLLAVGGCVGIVGARVIVRDLFPINEVARIFSTLMLVLGVSPIIAPSVGAYVSQAYSWRLIFGILAAIATIILICIVRYLPESRASDKSISLHPVRIVRDYLNVLKEPKFIAYGMASAAASAGLFAYISDSPFVYMKLFDLTEQQFGCVFGLSACGVIGASQFNRFLLKTRSSRSISMVAVIAQLIITVSLIVGVLSGLPMLGVIVMIFSYLACIGFLSPNTTALAIEPFTKYAGTASALMGSIQMAAGALGSALVSHFHNGTALPMAVLLLASAIGSLALQTWYMVRERNATI
jgi:DHA1 family bicyclomycin/chloramphenicol resistance-like MFS transporter